LYRVTLSDIEPYRVICMSFLDRRVHERIVEKKKRLDALRPLPASVVRRVEREMEVSYVFNSNAIEGNTIKLRETQMILERGLTIQGKSLREHLEVTNHPKAIDYVERMTKRDLKEQDILVLHQIIMKGIDDEAGRFRTTEVNIAGADFIPPPAYEIPHLVKDLVDWYNRNPDELRPIELSAILHRQFVWIHPFHDGNGRVARLLTNLALLRFGYPIAVILNVDKAKYYDTLRKADGGDKAPFVGFVAAATEASLDLYLRSLEPTGGGDRLVSLSDAAKISRYSQEYLSLLSRKRRIAAVKVGRKWMITERELRRYAKEMEQDNSAK
jgi:Fic family protein